MTTNQFVESGYSSFYINGSNLINLLDPVVSGLLELRRTHHFDAIAIKGNSGASLGFIVSVVTKIPLILVRASGAGHHGCLVETIKRDIAGYVILDDFVDSGATIREIRNLIDTCVIGETPKCVGVFVYRKSMCTGSGCSELNIPVFGINGDDLIECSPKSKYLTQIGTRGG